MSVDKCDSGNIRFRHHIPVQIRFNDIDVLGHLNNSIYFSFMDLGKTRYFQEALGEKLHWGEFGAVIVNVNCDFCVSTFFDDEIEVETAVTRIGEKSLTLEQRVFSPVDGSVRCRCTTVMAGFDMKTLGSRVIPDEWREAFSKYESRRF